MSRLDTPESETSTQNTEESSESGGGASGGFSCVGEQASQNSLSQTQDSVDDNIFSMSRADEPDQTYSYQGSTQFSPTESAAHVGAQNCTGSLNTLNTSWYELEKNADKLMRDELNSVERSFSPEMQLSFFKSWFEGNFKNSFLFGHFLCLVKYALYEHVPDMTLDKDYLPASLLSLMRKRLSNYRQMVKEFDENIAQLNRKLAESLEEPLGDNDECRQSLKEIMLSYQQLLASATERAINSRQQAESLRLQLSEALTHVHHLENKLLLAEKSTSRLQDSLTDMRNSTTSREELERMIATEKAITETLRSQLGEELRSNQRLWATLKDKNTYLAVLEAQLAACMDDASRKSRLINILAEEVVQTLHDTLPPALLAPIPGNLDASSVGRIVNAWEDNIRSSIDDRNKEIRKLDRQLVDCELLLADLSYKIADKQEIVKYLDLEYGSLRQEEDHLRSRIESQDSQLRQLEDKSKYTEKKIAMVRQALDKKLDLLSCTKDRLERNFREIARLQKLRIAVPRDDSASEYSSFVDQNRDSAIGCGSSLTHPPYSAAEEQDAIKTFASFDGSRFLRRLARDPRWCSTPLKPSAQYSMLDETRYPPTQTEQSALKKIAAVRSPNRAESAQLNVRFKNIEQLKSFRGEAATDDNTLNTTTVATTSATPSMSRRAIAMADTPYDSGAGDTAANYDGSKETALDDSMYRSQPQQRQNEPSSQRKPLKSRDRAFNVAGRRMAWSEKLQKLTAKGGIGAHVLGKRGHFNETEANTSSNQCGGGVSDIRSPKRDSQWRH